MSTRTRGMGSAATTALLRPAKGVGELPPGQDHQGQQDHRTHQAHSLVSALAVSNGGAEIGSLQTVQLAEVAEHPDNPRESLGDLDELAASIKSLGLRQPIVVVPADKFRTANRHLTVPETAKWVILAGHRRRAAAMMAGLPAIPAWVRPDLTSREDAAETFVVENVHRAGLSALEEARVYALLTDLSGGSQREIARRCGVSQAHVSKRMSLLTLPQVAQDAITAGSLAVTDALALAAVDHDDQAAVFALASERSWPIPTAAQVLAERRRRAERVQAAHARAAAEGLDVIPENLAGWASAADSAAVEVARAAGTLRAAVGSDGAFRYLVRVGGDGAGGGGVDGNGGGGDSAGITSGGVGDGASGDEGTAVTGATGDARDALRAAARRFLQQRPSPRRVAALLADGVLAGAVVTPRTVERAAAWLGDSAGISDGGEGDSGGMTRSGTGDSAGITSTKQVGRPRTGGDDRVRLAAAAVLEAAIEAKNTSALHKLAVRTLRGTAAR